jgi:hypothetical protein
MSLYLKQLIHEDQKCVPGRKITKNIHIIQDLIDAICNDDDVAALILIDQEKAFDRISHTFMIKTLIAFGFPPNFIKWVKILYNKVTGRVKINVFLSEEFEIERGVRQGCPLSALLYVLCAEVLAIEIRGNNNIKGYKYNNLENEHKINSFADDMIFCITTDPSIDELFKVLHLYERATNSKINQDKTKALWIGQWKNRTDKPLGLKWTSSEVELTGVYIGNDRKAASRKSYEIIKNDIKNKLSYWNTKYISLKGKARTLNIFILSKLWYCLECMDIPSDILDEINRMIKAYFWKDLHQRELKVLCYPYEKGGLNLESITIKMKTFRIKWLTEMIGTEKVCIARWLVDKLIGTRNRISGLKVLNYQTNINEIKNEFYKNAIKIWYSIGVQFTPKNITTIKNDYIYENILLKDDDGRVYKPPGYYRNRDFPQYVPLLFKDLPVTFPLTRMSNLLRTYIPKINKSFRNIKFSNNNQDYYYISGKNNEEINFKDSNFKTIYKGIQNKEIDSRQIWVNKWKNDFQIEENEWEDIWMNVHDILNNYQVQSSMWELFHRNYMCAYFAKLVFNKSGNCKLCGKLEQKRTHILLNCEVSKSVIKKFEPILLVLHREDLSIKETIFGMLSNNQINKRLYNYIIYSIRHVIFRSRNIDFANINAAVSAITLKAKRYIRDDLKCKYHTALNKNGIQKFRLTYLYNNILGEVINDTLEIKL